jgi:hypothetical protein
VSASFIDDPGNLFLTGNSTSGDLVSRENNQDRVLVAKAISVQSGLRERADSSETAKAG